MNLSRTYAGCSACLVDSGSQRFAGLSFSNTDKVARAKAPLPRTDFSSPARQEVLVAPPSMPRKIIERSSITDGSITAGFRRSDLRRRYLIAYARRGTV